MKPFAVRANDGVALFGNPQWTIRYVGLETMYAIFRLSRDYHNRCLTAPGMHLWLHHLSLTPQEREMALRLPLGDAVSILQSRQFV
jgi:hypothetical protein